MKEEFDVLLNEYLKDDSVVVNSGKNYYVEFVKKLPQYLYQFFDKKRYLIKASVGAGQKSEIPWLCIFNREITDSATKGIYICYLFKKDMSGFYLALGQGITTFSELYGVDKYKNIKKVAEYFRNLIDDNGFSTEKIDLKGSKELAKGYEAGVIISKYYEKGNYSESQLFTDLMNVKEIYDDIAENLMDSSYMDIVDRVLTNKEPSYVSIEEANKIINEVLTEERSEEKAQRIIPKRVDIPKGETKKKYTSTVKKKIKKVDYLKKAKSNITNGLLGEQLIINYEKDRLIKLGREDLAKNIKWISKDDDGVGYDIISFDIDECKQGQERFIEVKSTEGNDRSEFYISANEMKVMEKLKNQYFIYRVCNLKKKEPEVFILGYEDFKRNMELKIESYVVSIKSK